MRVLILDEDPARHDAYRDSLDPLFAVGVRSGDCKTGNIGQAGDHADIYAQARVHHICGHDAVAEVRRSLVAGDRFAVAFIGLSDTIVAEAITMQLREVDPDLNLVLMAQHDHHPPVDLERLAAPPEKILYLAGPFDSREVVQAVVALGARWKMDRELAGSRSTPDRPVAAMEPQAAVAIADDDSRALHLAAHDPLTQAPNRLAFFEAVRERARRPGVFAIAAVDLDRFKLVNDTLGHVTGDAILRETCGLLQSLVPDGGMVARLAGDEFGILFDTAGAPAAVMACERMVAGCCVARRVLGHVVQTSVSAGVVVTEESERADPLDLMRKADLALNDAKRGGRNIARRYEAHMDEGTRVRRAVQDGLSRAIARGELEMLFQPIVASRGLEIAGFEALLRWDTDEFGSISPGIFIPIVEESDLIHELGDWVIETSLDALRRWPGQYVSVNFSPRQFRRANFVGYVLEKVQKAGVEPLRVQIEITETALFDDVERAAETLYRLRQMGFRVALDDFGTGYSNLYNMRKFALDAVKIDRSFIEELERERVSAAIVRSITQLGRALQLEVVAEGVETQGQVALLRAAGVSHFQGYLLSHPVRAEVAQALVEAGSIGRQVDVRSAAMANAAA